jgi:hypothetical protein
MRFLGLTVRITVLAALAIPTFGPARLALADARSSKVTLALSAEPAAGKKALVDEPGPSTADDEPTNPTARGTSWWVWVVMGAAAASVTGLVLASTGKDPSCPGDRVCQ